LLQGCHDYSYYDLIFVFFSLDYRNIEFDFVGKLETFNRDLEKINQIVHLSDRIEVPHRNKKTKSSQHNYLNYYDDETIQIVNRIFERDFKEFGYQPITNLEEYHNKKLSLL